MNPTKEDWIVINNTPTHICTWGKGITDKWQSDSTARTGDTNTNQPVILMFPGNPGIIRFYYTFLQAIYKIVATPVWILSHAGHEKRPKGSGDDVSVSCNPNNVAFQVDHKAEFIKQYVPADSDIYIIAHSFGAKITIELLKREGFRNRVKGCYLLFPTLQWIGDTYNGRKIKFINQYLFSSIMVLSFIYSVLPLFLKWWLVKVYFLVCGRWKIDSNCVTAVVDLINPTTLRNVFTLAGNEMDVIKELDKEVIKECTDKLRIYYGMADDWAPLSHHYDLLQQVPTVESNVLDAKYEHCFVLETAEDLATEISQRISNDVAASSKR